MRIIDADKLKIPSEEMIAKMAIAHAPTIKTKQIRYFDEDEQVWKIGEVIVSDSEKPNNLERSE